MKINSITPNTAYLRNDVSMRTLGSGKGKERAFTKQNNYENINTTIKSNSDGRVSFKGGVPLLHRAASFASDNPLLAEALFALIITCGARPLTIMATAKNDEDKEKCSYQAMKSIASGLIGLAATFLISEPTKAGVSMAQKRNAFKITPEYKEQAKTIVSKGVEALKATAKKYTDAGTHLDFTEQISNLIENGKFNINIFKSGKGNTEKAFIRRLKVLAPENIDSVKQAIKAQRTLNNFEDTGTNVMKKIFQPIFMPIRANITIALVPVLLGLLGKHKPNSNKKDTTKLNSIQNINHSMFFTENEKALFNSFSGVANHENK